MGGAIAPPPPAPPSGYATECNTHIISKTFVHLAEELHNFGVLKTDKLFVVVVHVYPQVTPPNQWTILTLFIALTISCLEESAPA